MLAVGTTLVLGADWGDPVAVGVVVVAGSAAAVGVVALVASIARTPEAAANGTAMVATVAGALGGSFFPIVDDGVLAVVAALTPHWWFLEGIEGAAGGEGLGAVAGDVAVLMAMALVAGGVAVLRLRERLAAS